MNNFLNQINASILPFTEMSGYEPKTTFWQDFSIADRFGIKAIRDTYKRAFDEWKDDHIFITELTMILNWKIWQLHETKPELAELYDELWTKTRDWCFDNLKGDELAYFIRTTD